MPANDRPPSIAGVPVSWLLPCWYGKRCAAWLSPERYHFKVGTCFPAEAMEVPSYSPTSVASNVALVHERLVFTSLMTGRPLPHSRRALLREFPCGPSRPVCAPRLSR